MLIVSPSLRFSFEATLSRLSCQLFNQHCAFRVTRDLHVPSETVTSPSLDYLNPHLWHSSSLSPSQSAFFHLASLRFCFLSVFLFLQLPLFLSFLCWTFLIFLQPPNTELVPWPLFSPPAARGFYTVPLLWVHCKDGHWICISSPSLVYTCLLNFSTWMSTGSEPSSQKRPATHPRPSWVVPKQLPKCQGLLFSFLMSISDLKYTKHNSGFMPLPVSH